MTKSFICWVGGKAKLLWLLHKLFPTKVSRFIDVFGGSGTVLLSRPIMPGTMEVYNDYNSDLVNLMRCVKEKPLALVRELGFLPLNSRDDFNILYRFLQEEEFGDRDLEEELELTETLLEPPDCQQIRTLLMEKAQNGDVRRAAAYFKLVRCSFSGNTKTFGGKPCDIRRFFCDIWNCSRRLSEVVVENKDCVDVVVQYDREDGLIYSDPPYYEAERLYEVVFGERDHIRLHDALSRCVGFVVVSYNQCAYIQELYKDFYIFHTTRTNDMSQKVGSEYHELVMTNYDPNEHANGQTSLFFGDEGSYQLIHTPEEPLREKNIAQRRKKQELQEMEDAG